MFGLASSKRVKELEEKLRNIPVVDRDPYESPTLDIKDVLCKLQKQNKDLQERLTDIERENRIWIIPPTMEVGQGSSVKFKNGAFISNKDAILKLAAHLGLKFHVEPSKPQAITLVKEKKR